MLLATVDEAALQKQKEKLAAQLPAEKLALPPLLAIPAGGGQR